MEHLENHTPLPWKREGRTFYDANGRYLFHIARSDDNTYFSPVELDENAKAVELAVNAYHNLTNDDAASNEPIALGTWVQMVTPSPYPDPLHHEWRELRKLWGDSIHFVHAIFEDEDDGETYIVVSSGPWGSSASGPYNVRLWRHANIRELIRKHNRDALAY